MDRRIRSCSQFAGRWKLSKGFPKPPVQVANPRSSAQVELGRRLFYDKRLSVNGKQSWATCHRQELAFTDGLPHAQGATGELHPRSSMSLVNVAYMELLTWANPSLSTLEVQALIPMFGTVPIELGLKVAKSTFWKHSIATLPIRVRCSRSRQ
jgi:cytochrome c peroxidase